GAPPSDRPTAPPSVVSAGRLLHTDIVHPSVTPAATVADATIDISRSVARSGSGATLLMSSAAAESNTWAQSPSARGPDHPSDGYQGLSARLPSQSQWASWPSSSHTGLPMAPA